MQRILRLLSDRTRLRILAAVEPEELAVNEIAEVLDMSQPRISNHLRLLREGEALHGRREGAWTFYRNALPDLPQAAALWSVVRAGLDDDPAWEDDAERRRSVLEKRRERSRAHFAAANGSADTGDALELGTLREEILAAYPPASLVAVDAGCGDGFLTETLAERFDRVLAFDHSERRLAAARRRVRSDHVKFECAEIDALPLEAGRADVVFSSLVLHHVPEIGAALREARRVLRTGGRLVVADLAPHDEEALRDRMGDLRLGLEPDALLQALRQAGFDDVRLLPVRDRMRIGRRKSLAFFLATGTKPAASRKRKKTKR